MRKLYVYTYIPSRPSTEYSSWTKLKYDASNFQCRTPSSATTAKEINSTLGQLTYSTLELMHNCTSLEAIKHHTCKHGLCLPCQYSAQLSLRQSWKRSKFNSHLHWQSRKWKKVKPGTAASCSASCFTLLWWITILKYLTPRFGFTGPTCYT